MLQSERLRLTLTMFLIASLPACQPSRPQDDTLTVQDEATDAFAAQRTRMVRDQLRSRGIREQAVLAAMARVPRHRFVPTMYEDMSYADHPVPIGFDQTISQPYIVAYMTEAAQVSPSDKVLEVGTGSGYQAAILGELAREVYTIEIIPELASGARTLLEELGYKNVHVRTGDGYAGWKEHAPFDAIVVTAAPDHVPQALVDQLAVNGRMIIPVGTGEQEMRVITRTAKGVTQQSTLRVRFVPLVRSPANPEAEFRNQLGRKWELASLGAREIPPPPPGTPRDVIGKDLVPGRRPTISFNANPAGAGGRSFCNGYGGPYVIRGDSLRIDRIESSAVGCDTSDSLETRFFRGLRDTRRFEIDSRSLVLITADGMRLTFVPAEPDSVVR